VVEFRTDTVEVTAIILISSSLRLDGDIPLVDDYLRLAS
jgi:hypothetical protein